MYSFLLQSQSWMGSDWSCTATEKMVKVALVLALPLDKDLPI